MIAHYGSDSVTEEDFYSLCESTPSIIAIDVETISLKEKIPIGFAVAYDERNAWWVDVFPDYDERAEKLRALLTNPKVMKVFHNAIFDFRVLTLATDVDMTNFRDTNVMARLLGYTETGLDVLSWELLSEGHVTANELMQKHGCKTMLGVPRPEVAEMCCIHARHTLALYRELDGYVDDEYLQTEMKVIPILLETSLRGLKVNQNDRARVERKLKEEQEFYFNLCQEYNFNPGSNQQTGYILAKRGNFLPFTRSKKQYKCDKETLEFVDDPLAAIVLSYRQISKLLSTYIVPLAEEDRIYTHYNLDAVVGRISSSERNLQNIPPPNPDNPFLPEGCRFIFEPDSGVFTTGDYAQEHLYILMHMAGDRQMERVYYEGEADGDIHLFTAKEMGIPRRLAKTINYALLYGATAKTISVHAKIRDLKKCSALLDKWFSTFRDAAEWIRGAQEEGMRTGWALPTLFGRQIRIPEEYDRWGKLNTDSMMRKAVNYPILGSDGEVMKRALIICDKYKLPLSVTVHDSITCDGDIEFPIEELENIAPVRIPFKVKKTLRWE